MQEHAHGMQGAADRFPTDPGGLPEAARPALVELGDGEALDLRVAPVAKRVDSGTLRMLAYNGSVPGPTLVVQQGSEILVDVTNEGDLETTVHWHGLRLENRYDGVPHETQAPIAVGERFTYRLEFPDPGLYWYHPHVREDYAQELGLYGNILVRPDDRDYWPPADREVVLTLDDILLEDGKVVPFGRTETTHAAMGRFGNQLLVNGEPSLRLSARTGEVVRLWLTNTAGTRVFDVRLPGARMKLVGGDSGRVEHEELVTRVMLAPSERAVVDVLFDRPGEARIEHRTPERTYTLATVTVHEEPTAASAAGRFEMLRRAPELEAERRRFAVWRPAPPDKTLALVAEMDDMDGRSAHEAEPAREHAHDGHDSRDVSDGIEWEDEMPAHSRVSSSSNTRWRFVERTARGETDPRGWRFTIGDRVKIRLVNEMASDHPMHHPFHVHGAGRFLVLARDGAVEPNLVWKDSVLIRTGETVDILLDVTNPGSWMAHCHIPEHMHSGMMFSFTVAS